MAAKKSVCIFLCGDVMTGRGIDQVLQHPCDPTLHESFIRNARDYVRLAEKAHGAIEHPVQDSYIWGDALGELRRQGADVRIINLETSVTTSDEHWPGKAVHYRMNPRNIGCITAAGIDCCTLANNHVLDWGYPGLEETLKTLDEAKVARCGAGRNAAEAGQPAVLHAPGKGRVLVFSFGSPTSGVPSAWAAREDRPGVNFLEELSEETAARLADEVRQARRPGDLAVVSLHGGPNWGYRVPHEQVRFAHRLIEEGVDVVHGHSSHHVKALEVYQGRPILYGCGDFLNDYEGIRGREEFRPDLTLMYFLRLRPADGTLTELRLVPMQVRHFRLSRAGFHDAEWLAQTLNREGERFGTAVELHDDQTMTVCLSQP